MLSLHLPPSLRHFEPLRHPEMPGADPPVIEYDLVEALRPRLVVDLGAGSGVAFAAMCQSARDHDVDALCYAVDPWPEDADEAAATGTGAGSASLNNFLHTYFRGTSYVLKMTEGNARQHFAAGTIDLLRIDARRLGAPLGELLDVWLPKVAPRGVVVADLASDADREAWRARTGGGGIVVPASTPLGVHAPGGPAAGVPGSSELRRWLSSGDAAEREDLAAFYAHAVRHHALRREVRDEGGGLFRKKAGA